MQILFPMINMGKRILSKIQKLTNGDCYTD